MIVISTLQFRAYVVTVPYDPKTLRPARALLALASLALSACSSGNSSLIGDATDSGISVERSGEVGEPGASDAGGKPSGRPGESVGPSNGQPDNGGAGPGSNHGSGGHGSDGAGSGTEPASGVVLANLSYVNHSGRPEDTEATFVLRNETYKDIAEIRAVTVAFGGTQVLTVDSPTCIEWRPSQKSSTNILRVKIAHIDVPDDISTTLMTCGGGLYPPPNSGGHRPRTTIGSIGKGRVSVTVTGLFADAAPFVARAEASAP